MSSEALKATPDIEPVHSGISDNDRETMRKLLGAALADTYVLLVKSHVYHWNVVGPLFYSLHKLLEEHYNDLFQAADDIAERIRALGFPAPLNFESLERRAKVAEESDLRSAHGMVSQLVDDHRQIVQRIRDIATRADEMHDHATHDLLTARLDFHEKAAWMLSATIAE